MNGMHLDASRSWQRHAFRLSACVHSWAECHEEFATKSLGRKKKNWAALCHGRHAFRLRMPFMAECHEEFRKEKEKLGSTLP